MERKKRVVHREICMKCSERSNHRTRKRGGAEHAEKTEDNTNVSGTEHVISYNLGDLAEDFTEMPEKAQGGNKVEIRTQVLYDAGIHLYLD